MTQEYFEHLLPEIDGYYDRHRPNVSRAEWHEAWLKADGMQFLQHVNSDVWFAREDSGDGGLKVRLLAFMLPDESLLSSEELYKRIGSWGISEDDLQQLLG